ncbi:ABC transporter substrate-binding protein [Amphibacillus sediminis]|uniref:ABC transporter substrate-binding protein n=1 Tax=Amphibacillus sediminis TaxID=360185 RepID=UPI00082B54E7|nr:extracellular solute-binding protein [Amphibacillus sediminis]
MKRNAMFSLLFVVLAMFLLVAGCSSDDGSTGGSTENDNNTGEGDSGEEHDDSGLPPMTDEEITLTFGSWLTGEMNTYLAEKFMEKYPNIKVEVIEASGDLGWNDFLTNLASDGDLPDVFWYNGNLDVAIRNMWLGDFTEYFEADPETDRLLDTLVDVGYFDGERKLAAASAQFPFAVFLDENLFEQQNVEMPSPDWTYSEMLDLIEEMTIPEQGIYGVNMGTNLVTMAPIVNEDAYGEFGWDGERFDMTGEWADSVTKRAEFVRNGNHAPFGGTDEAEAAFGDRDIWAAETGKVAIHFDAFWTIGQFKLDAFTDKGINFVPYPVPRGDNAETLNKPAYVDLSSISPVTEHPREAYELMKFMGWGREGWEHRLEAFRSLTYDNGERVFNHPEGLPLLKDEELWEELRKLLPEGHYYDDYLERVKHPISLGGRVLPGFDWFLDEVYFGGEYGNVEDAVMNGEVNAHDVAGELTDLLNSYHQKSLDELFY